MKINELFNKIYSALPGLLGAALLLVIALLMAFLAKKLTTKGLDKVEFDSKLQKWGMAKNDEESSIFIETIGSLVYFVTILLFTPFIFTGLNLSGVADPVIIMLNKFWDFIPNLLVSVMIIIIGSYLCKFIYKLNR